VGEKWGSLTSDLKSPSSATHALWLGVDHATNVHLHSLFETTSIMLT